MLELSGGFLTGQGGLRPSEPYHSPNKVMPSYYTKSESFASGISKMWCVCLLTSTIGGIYRAVGELHRLGEVRLVPSGGRSAKPHGWPVRWSGLHRLGLLLLM
jgi:hypothetical protein